MIENTMLDYTIDPIRTKELSQLQIDLDAAYLLRGKTGQKDAAWNRCFRALSEAITQAVSEGLSVQVTLKSPGEMGRQVTIRTMVSASVDGMIVSEYRPAPGERKRNTQCYPQKAEVYLPDITEFKVWDERTHD